MYFKTNETANSILQKIIEQDKSKFKYYALVDSLYYDEVVERIKITTIGQILESKQSFYKELNKLEQGKLTKQQLDMYKALLNTIYKYNMDLELEEKDLLGISEIIQLNNCNTVFLYRYGVTDFVDTYLPNKNLSLAIDLLKDLVFELSDIGEKHWEKTRYAFDFIVSSSEVILP